MIDRSFNETDLREMLEVATAFRPDIHTGRWIVETMRGRSPWEVIVEADQSVKQLVVVTAYPVTR